MKDLRTEFDKKVNAAGFFSFVNIIWFFSIIGITCTVGPCCYFVFSSFLTCVTNAIVDIIKFIYREIVFPFVTFIHNIGFIELVLYFIAF